MRDGSDAIADWPILNALLNTAAGATWVSVHHGGGVGIGNSIHAGMVVLADGTDDAADRLERVLTADPGTGVMRHADAGYEEALDAAREGGLDLPVGAERAARVTRMAAAATVAAAGPRPRAGRHARPAARAAARAARSRRSTSSRTPSSSARGGAIEAVGPMRGPAGRSTATSRRSTVAGSARCPGSSTATRMPASPATASASSRSGRAARRYEELHAAGGGILSTVRATRAAGARGARRDRGRAPPRSGCARTGRRPSRASRATGSITTRSSRSSGPCEPPAACRPGSARTRVPPEFDDAGRLPRLPARRRASRGGTARRGGRRLSRARLLRRRAGAPLPEACRGAGLALRLHGDQFTESGAIPLAIELGARSVDHLEATGARASQALAASDVTGVLLPASALFLGRPMPPARALVDAGAAIALATDFNPGSAFCESLPLVCSLACTQMQLAPEEALVGLHRQRRPRARPRRHARPDRAGLRGGPRPARRLRTGATSPTTSAGDIVTP